MTPPATAESLLRNIAQGVRAYVDIAAHTSEPHIAAPVCVAEDWLRHLAQVLCLLQPLTLDLDPDVCQEP